MTQYYRNTSLAVSSSSQTFVNVATGKARGKTLGNVTLANTAPGASATLTVTYLSQKNGTEIDTVPPGQTLYSPGVAVDDILISSTGQATIALDVRYPESLPPQSLTVSGGSISVTGIVETDVGQGTAPSPIVKPTGGDLTSGNAVIASITDSVATNATITGPLDGTLVAISVKKPNSVSGYVETYNEESP